MLPILTRKAHLIKTVILQHHPIVINYPEDIFKNNATELRKDLTLSPRAAPVQL